MHERIREIRKYYGLTMEKFGERLGIKKNTVSQLENGVNNVTDQMVKAISREYDVNPDWLRTGEGEMFSDDEDYLFRWVGKVLKDKPESLKKRLLNFLSSLDEDDWEALEKIFNKMSHEKRDKE